MAFATKAVKDILSQATYSQEYTDLRNSVLEHEAFGDLTETLQKVANMVGINFADTGFTFTVKSKGEDFSVYEPSVMSFNGQPCIIWGEVRKPLDDISDDVVLSVRADRKMMFLVASKGRDEYRFVIRVKKGLTVSESSLKEALYDGKLAEYLSESFVKPRKLSELEPGEYKVINYSTSLFKGETKYAVLVDGQGWFSANSPLSRELVDSPIISEEKPADMVIGVSTEVYNGHKIIPVKLITEHKKSLPVFSF